MEQSSQISEKEILEKLHKSNGFYQKFKTDIKSLKTKYQELSNIESYLLDTWETADVNIKKEIKDELDIIWGFLSGTNS